MDRVTMACLQRTAFVSEQLGISVLSNATGENWKRVLYKFLEAKQYDVNLRAGLGLLIVNGEYPTQTDFESIQRLVRLGDIDNALRRLLTHANLSLTRDIPLEAVNGALADITRYSEEGSFSGIPRVVRNFILSKPGIQLARIVWVGGQIGVVDVDSISGKVTFGTSWWYRANRGSRLAIQFIEAVRRLAFISPRSALIAYSVAQLLPIGVILNKLRSRVPKKCVFLANTTVVVCEVMSREVADRLITWQRVGLNVSTRFFLHDILPLTRSEYFESESSHEYLRNLEAYLAADRVFVSTPMLADELAGFSAALGVTAPPCEVNPIPFSMLDNSIRTKSKQSEPYVVFMGGYEPRKRLADFVDNVHAFRDIGVNFRVVIVGRPPLLRNKHDVELISMLVARQDIFMLRSNLTDLALAALLSEAIATVYVSEAEGYGLPILESLTLGTPVITAPTAVNAYLANLYGGILPIFDASPSAVIEIQRLMNPVYRASITASIVTAAIPCNIDIWAEKIIDGLHV